MPILDWLTFTLDCSPNSLIMSRHQNKTLGSLSWQMKQEQASRRAEKFSVFLPETQGTCDTTISKWLSDSILNFRPKLATLGPFLEI
jgi:hypothetical protein